MSGVELDLENKILYVDGIVAAIEGQPTPEYIKYIQTKLSSADAQLAKHSADLELFGRALVSPDRWTAVDLKIAENYCHRAKWHIEKLKSYRQSLMMTLCMVSDFQQKTVVDA